MSAVEILSGVALIAVVGAFVVVCIAIVLSK